MDHSKEKKDDTSDTQSESKPKKICCACPETKVRIRCARKEACPLHTANRRRLTRRNWTCRRFGINALPRRARRRARISSKSTRNACVRKDSTCDVTFGARPVRRRGPN
eukprot:scaffold324_cov326-Pavlova_lutheri.AAC.52